MPNRYLHQNCDHVSYNRVMKKQKSVKIMRNTILCTEHSTCTKITSLRKCQKFALLVLPTIFMPGDIILPTRKISVMEMFRKGSEPRVAYSKTWLILRGLGTWQL